MPVAGHQGPGSIADTTVRKLLMLQGLARPKRIVSLMSYPGAAAAHTSPNARDAIQVTFGALGTGGTGGARVAAQSASGLTPREWIELLDRLGEIPDPTVASGHSSAAIPDGVSPPSGQASEEGQARGNY